VQPSINLFTVDCWLHFNYRLGVGRINAATIADHIEPHKGDQQKFFFGELQSLCKLHHESAKKREEASGYSTQIGTDGCPRGLAVSLCHRRAFRRQELHP